MKIKSIVAEVQDFNLAKGEADIYVSAFGNIDAHGDVMVKGCYQKSIAEKLPKGLIKHLWQHDTCNVIGRPISMVEDEKGLLVRTFISDVKNGDYRKLYQDGIINQHSVGFVEMGANEQTINGEEINYITEADLWEYSSVTWGANPETGVEDMRMLSKALRDGNYTDETFKELEKIIKSIQTQIELLKPKKVSNNSESINIVEIYKNL